jgi:hypothetical protein
MSNCGAVPVTFAVKVVPLPCAIAGGLSTVTDTGVIATQQFIL